MPITLRDETLLRLETRAAILEIEVSPKGELLIEVADHFGDYRVIDLTYEEMCVVRDWLNEA